MLVKGQLRNEEGQFCANAQNNLIAKTQLNKAEADLVTEKAKSEDEFIPAVSTNSKPAKLEEESTFTWFAKTVSGFFDSLFGMKADFGKTAAVLDARGVEGEKAKKELNTKLSEKISDFLNTLELSPEEKANFKAILANNQPNLALEKIFTSTAVSKLLAKGKIPQFDKFELEIAKILESYRKDGTMAEDDIDTIHYNVKTVSAYKNTEELKELNIQEELDRKRACELSGRCVNAEVSLEHIEKKNPELCEKLQESSEIVKKYNSDGQLTERSRKERENSVTKVKEESIEELTQEKLEKSGAKELSSAEQKEIIEAADEEVKKFKKQTVREIAKLTHEDASFEAIAKEENSKLKKVLGQELGDMAIAGHLMQVADKEVTAWKVFQSLDAEDLSKSAVQSYLTGFSSMGLLTAEQAKQGWDSVSKALMKPDYESQSYAQEMRKRLNEDAKLWEAAERKKELTSKENCPPTYSNKESIALSPELEKQERIQKLAEEVGGSYQLAKQMLASGVTNLKDFLREQSSSDLQALKGHYDYILDEIFRDRVLSFGIDFVPEIPNPEKYLTSSSL